MLFSSELPVQSAMLASIFKNPLSLSAASPSRKQAIFESPKSHTSLTDNFSEGSSPNQGSTSLRGRSLSADSGLGMNQSVKFKVEVAPVIVERPVEDYVQRTKKSAGYLRLLLHSKRCGGLCMKAACIKTSSVVDHVNKCFDPQCTYPGCITSKKLLEHHDTCALNMSLNTGLSNFCLLCSLVPQATTSPTNRSHYLSPDQNNAYGTPQLEESDRYSEVYDRRTHDGCFVHAFCRTASQDPGYHPSASSDSPIMFDEMIEYNKVPFQDSRSEYLRHSMTSDLPPNVYSDEPPRKIRSKSMNAVSIDWTA